MWEKVSLMARPPKYTPAFGWRRSERGLRGVGGLRTRAKDQRWIADVIEFATFEGNLHLAAIVDLYSSRLLGCAIVRAA